MEEGRGKREEGRGTAKLWLALGAVAVAVVAIAVWWVVAKSGEAESGSLQRERHAPSRIVDAASAGKRTATVGRGVPSAPESQEGEVSRRFGLSRNSVSQIKTRIEKRIIAAGREMIAKEGL